jgi:hypothetical protein
MANPKNKRKTMPPSPRQKAGAAARSRGHNKAPKRYARKRGGGSGFDPGKFASEVSGNFARGVAHVGREVDKAIPTRSRSNSIPGAVKNAPNNRKVLWGK